MSPETLLAQFYKAGVRKSSVADFITDQDKSKLLDYLRRTYGGKTAGETKTKITLTRKSTTDFEVTKLNKRDASGCHFELRKKRLLVRRPMDWIPLWELDSRDKINSVLSQFENQFPWRLVNLKDWMNISATKRAELREVAKTFPRASAILKYLDNRMYAIKIDKERQGDDLSKGRSSPKPMSLITTKPAVCGSPVPLSAEQQRVKDELEALEREEIRGIIDAHFDVGSMIKE